MFKFWISILIGVLTIAGCALKYQLGQRISQKKVQGFTHKIHTENEMTCKVCHLKALTSAEAGMPDERLCGFCHRKVYDNQPVEKFYNKEEWLSSYKVKRTEFFDLKMSHQLHAGEGVKCESCHGNIGDSTRIMSGHIPYTDTCLQCHEEWNSPSQCNTCHKEIRYDTTPPSHIANNFMRIHGQIFREESTRPDKGLSAIQSCSRCHSDDYCINCHQNQAPDDHNNQWRLIGHGITAGIDRNRCDTCHKTDFCFRCHENTRARSHLAAGWGQPNNRHCQSCHLPIGSTDCIVCHKDGTPSHLEILPGDHRAGWGDPINRHCFSCHRESATCGICHEGAPSHQEVEPATHTALWSSPNHNHCLRCHLPIGRARRCDVCHDRVPAHFTEAPQIPRDITHSQGLDCRVCHFPGSQILIHADNGQNCQTCHQ